MNKITKVIIPVAGLGTRFLPATKAQPKEMLVIVDKPVIQFLAEEAVASGIKEIIFVTGKGKRAIEDHFDYNFELEHVLGQSGKYELVKLIRNISDMARFAYVRQKRPRGDGDAVLTAAHLVGNEPVAVLFGDDLVVHRTPCLKQLMKVFEKYQAPVMALEKVPRRDVSFYCVIGGRPIDSRTYEIKSIVEKPPMEKAPSDLTIVGKYIITPEIFAELRRLALAKGEIRLSHALGNYLKRGPVYGYRFEGERFDCGSKIGFIKATISFGLKHPEIGKEMRKYLKSIATGAAG